MLRSAGTGGGGAGLEKGIKSQSVYETGSCIMKKKKKGAVTGPASTGPRGAC